MRINRKIDGSGKKIDEINKEINEKIDNAKIKIDKEHTH